MPDLHARLLAEIERREEIWSTPEPMTGEGLPSDEEVLAYLAALRGVVELHRNAGGGCHECEYDWPCSTLRCVAEGLGVEA